MPRAWALVPLILLVSSIAMPQDHENAPVRLSIDHVTICGSDLDTLRQAFASVGLPTEYGGPHANGKTHMSLLGFADGSYLELIAPVEANQLLSDDSPWPKEIGGNAGPCGWAINVHQIEAEVARLRQRGLNASDPAPGGRLRPDRVALEWETAALAGREEGRLPFLIEDHTPRQLRAHVSPALHGSELTGVAVVIVGVRKLDASTELFQRAFTLPEPVVQRHGELGATLASFPGAPVILAAPLDRSGWLGERLRQFHEMPAAVLIGTRDFEASRKRFHLTEAAGIAGHRVAWFNASQLKGIRLGIIAQP